MMIMLVLGRVQHDHRLDDQIINTPSRAWQYPLLAWMFV
jgi:hypothetical protein